MLPPAGRLSKEAERRILAVESGIEQATRLRLPIAVDPVMRFPIRVEGEPDIAGAAGKLADVLADEPASRAARAELNRMYVSLEKPEAAVACWRRLPDGRPRSAALKLGLADALMHLWRKDPSPGILGESLRMLKDAAGSVPCDALRTDLAMMLAERMSWPADDGERRAMGAACLELLMASRAQTGARWHRARGWLQAQTEDLEGAAASLERAKVVAPATDRAPLDAGQARAYARAYANRTGSEAAKAAVATPSASLYFDVTDRLADVYLRMGDVKRASGQMRISPYVEPFARTIMLNSGNRIYLRAYHRTVVAFEGGDPPGTEGGAASTTKREFRTASTITLVEVHDFALPGQRDRDPLIVVGTDSDGEDRARLYCLDTNLRLLWSRQIASNQANWVDDSMFVRFARFGDIDGKPGDEIVCAANHRIWLTSRLRAFRRDGTPIGDYWSPGHWIDAVVVGPSPDLRPPAGSVYFLAYNNHQPMGEERRFLGRLCGPTFWGQPVPGLLCVGGEIGVRSPGFYRDLTISYEDEDLPNCVAWDGRRVILGQGHARGEPSRARAYDLRGTPLGPSPGHPSFEKGQALGAFMPGRLYAVVASIERYEHWTPPRDAHKDAAELAGWMVERGYARVQPMRDGEVTLPMIRNAIMSMKLDPGDTLWLHLIAHAEAVQGPDGPDLLVATVYSGGSGDRTNTISVRELVNYLGVRARDVHVVLSLDTCRSAATLDADEIEHMVERWRQEPGSPKAHCGMTIFTATGKTREAYEGYFTPAITRSLEAATGPEGAEYLLGELISNVKRDVMGRTEEQLIPCHYGDNDDAAVIARQPYKPQRSTRPPEPAAVLTSRRNDQAP